MFGSVDAESMLFVFGLGAVLHLQDVVGAAVLGTGCLALSGASVLDAIRTTLGPPGRRSSEDSLCKSSVLECFRMLYIIIGYY